MLTHDLLLCFVLLYAKPFALLAHKRKHKRNYALVGLAGHKCKHKNIKTVCSYAYGYIAEKGRRACLISAALSSWSTFLLSWEDCKLFPEQDEHLLIKPWRREVHMCQS